MFLGLSLSTSKNQPSLHILLAVDGSDHTRAAAQLLGYLPLRPGSQVTAASLLPGGRQAAPEALPISLLEMEMILKDHQVTVTHERLSGQPAKALTDWARVQQPDLLVVSASGLQAPLGFLLDGPAQQVVGLADQPVLVARSPCRKVRQVLLAVEGSSYSWAAANFLARFPFPADTWIQVMHVLPPRFASASYVFAYPSGPESLPPPTLTPEAADAMGQEIAYKESQARTNLSQVVKTLRVAGKAATSVLAHGDAATEILKYSQTHAIDLIVAGSRGLGRLAGWLMGSVSRQLIHRAGCAVLVVKGQPPGQN